MRVRKVCSVIDSEYEMGEEGSFGQRRRGGCVSSMMMTTSHLRGR